jgi:hypothetical protein
VATIDPQLDAVSYERMVGTLRFAHPLRTPSRTLPRRVKFAEYFPQNHGGRVFHGTAHRHAFAAKKPRLAARKIAQILVAFSLPQDSHIELMFGAACFGEPHSSVSHSLGFHVTPRGRRSPQRLGTPHKCFNRHRIFNTTRRFAAPCGLNACSAAVFRKHRRA